MRLSSWDFLRICLGLSWLTTTIYVAIPDYPYDYKLWYSICMDPNGFWHEAFYIATMFIATITLTYFWELLAVLRSGKGVFKLVLRRIEKDL